MSTSKRRLYLRVSMLNPTKSSNWLFSINNCLTRSRKWLTRTKICRTDWTSRVLTANRCSTLKQLLDRSLRVSMTYSSMLLSANIMKLISKQKTKFKLCKSKTQSRLAFLNSEFSNSRAWSFPSREALTTGPLKEKKGRTRVGQISHWPATTVGLEGSSRH